jgi:hypothetical protein
VESLSCDGRLGFRFPCVPVGLLFGVGVRPRVWSHSTYGPMSSSKGARCVAERGHSAVHAPPDRNLGQGLHGG